MSDPIAKAERSRAKDIRQGIEPQRERPQRKRKKIDKPFRVMMKWLFWKSGEWCVGRFATREQAERHIEKCLRGYSAPQPDDKYRIEERR